MAHELRQILSPARTKSLESVGIETVFGLLTLFPRRLQLLTPLRSLTQPNEEDQDYFLEGTLGRVETRKGKRPFFILHFQTGVLNFSGYYFVAARYTYGKLNVGETYQILANKRNNLWTIKKLEVRKAELDPKHFRLGRADLSRTYLSPVYPKTGKLTSAYFLAVHRQLPHTLYQISLAGLVPENELIPQQIDLYRIHHPETLEQYGAARSQWLALQAFLKMSLIKYLNLSRAQTKTRAGQLDVEFLKSLAEALPYTLSPSQKITIWELLQDLTINK